MGWYVTLMLAGGGAFCVFCAWRNYDWFFANHAARPFVRILGRKWARIGYILLGLFVLTPGIARIVRPPAVFTVDDARFFALPFGFPLLEPGATGRIRTTPSIGNLKEKDGQWEEFSFVLKEERFPVLRDPSSLFVDVDGGFNVNERKFDGIPHTGVVMYFDTQYRLCDNVLFSRTPLASAEFIVLVWDSATSLQYAKGNGLLVTLHRKGTSMYESFAR